MITRESIYQRGLTWISYTASLEARVAYLETELQMYRARDKTGEATEAVSPSSTTQMSDSGIRIAALNEDQVQVEHGTDADIRTSATVEEVLRLNRQPPGQVPSFSKIALTEILQSGFCPTTDMHRESSQERIDDFGIAIDLDVALTTLPSREATRNLFHAYFQHTDMSMPLLHEPTFQQKVELLYGMSLVVNLSTTHDSPDAKMAIFFVFEVLAVALLVLQKQDPFKTPTLLADRYHRTAVLALGETGVPHELEGVQALLLIGQYSHYHPTAWSSWKIVSQAMRLGVELGLHQDPPDELNFLQQDTIRRVFWVAYSMDRNLSTTMNLPCCLPDGAITTRVGSDPLQSLQVLTYPISILAMWTTSTLPQSRALQ